MSNDRGVLCARVWSSIRACMFDDAAGKREKGGPLVRLKGKAKAKKRAGQPKTVVVTPGAEQAQTRSPFWRHRQVQADLHLRLTALLSLSLPFSAFRLPLLLFLLPPRALVCNRADFEIEITRLCTAPTVNPVGFCWKFLTYVTRPRSLARSFALSRTLINGFLCGSLSRLWINWRGDCRGETKNTQYRNIRIL